MLNTEDMEKCYAWAKNQDYQSVSARAAKTLTKMVDMVRLENAALKAENKRLALCKHNCKIECLLDEYNKVVEERNALLARAAEEK